MKKQMKSEKGQALVLVALAFIGMLAMVALAIDGGHAFSDRRQAQNASDAGALYAARMFAESIDPSYAGASQAEVRLQVNNNGYNNGVNSAVVNFTSAVTSTFVPDGKDCRDFTVNITSTIQTFFAQVVGIPTITNQVAATAHSCQKHRVPLFFGNAIVGLNPDGNSFSFDAWGSANWAIHGGGVFSNSDARAKDIPTYHVVLDSPYCVTSVGESTGFPCTPSQNQTDLFFNYPADVTPLVPASPCYAGGRGKNLPDPDAVISGSMATFTNGIFCISDFDALDSYNIVMNNSTLYITDHTFDLRFNGSTGGFSGTATGTGIAGYDKNDPYYGFIVVVPVRDPGPPCPSFTSNNTQSILYRGNGLGDLTGTFLAPSACIDYRGNSNGFGANSQIIGYNVTSNGSANVDITYISGDNGGKIMPGSLELSR